jgi:hypothetical protein
MDWFGNANEMEFKLHLEERRTLLKKKKATETSVRKNTQLEFR